MSVELPVAALAGFWGLVAGSALLLGALAGYFLRLPPKVTSGVMAFGVGVLVSALAFDLMDEALAQGGLAPAAGGFALGAALFASANAILARQGARPRKQPRKVAAAPASLSIALGALLDGVPESAAIGISLLDGNGVALVTLAAIFISNVPEGLAGASDMKKAGRSAAYVFTVWGCIALACGAAAVAGYLVIGGLGAAWTALAIAIAAGAILVMIVDTMVPEAFETIHGWSGPFAAAGFLTAFIMGDSF